MELELLRTRRAKEELEMTADEQLCCVCMDRPKMVMFEPCCHVSVCKQCAPRIAQCPRRRAKGGHVPLNAGRAWVLTLSSLLGRQLSCLCSSPWPNRNPQPAVKSLCADTGRGGGRVPVCGSPAVWI